MCNVSGELFDEAHCTWHTWLPGCNKHPPYVPTSNSSYTAGHLIHISTTYCGNKTSYIEASIYDSFGLGTILSVPYVDLYNGHIQFWWDFDNSGPGGKDNIIKDMVVLENLLNIFRQDPYIQLFI